MLKREAEWLGSRIQRLDQGLLFPLINVGSSTRKVREIDQPWIDECIFAPMRRSGGRITHLDLKPDDGVDIVGDMNDPACWSLLTALAPRSVFCSNVLEHVTDRPALCSKIVELVAPGGFVILSVPRAFPYHPDPIDTMFRPSVDELVALFPGTRLLTGEIVDCGTLFVLLDRNLTRLARKVATMVVDRGRGAPAAEGGNGARGAGLADWLYPWAFRQFQATCAVLQKHA